MKKSGIALLLTVALLLGTVLGCFSFTAAAEENVTASVSIESYKAQIYQDELQILVNAEGDVKGYKLYDGNACVLESKYPIIVYPDFDAAKSYGITAVDENGNESALTAITVESEALDYNPGNLLAGKPFEMSNDTKRFAHTAATVKDWNWMTDGNMNTRYSTIGGATAKIDGTVTLGGVFALGELRLYDFDGNGTARCAGSHITVEIYTDGAWVEVASYDTKEEIVANYMGSGAKVGYIRFDLLGYNAEAIRIVNDGITSNNDALSYWEITLSGMRVGTFSKYVFDKEVDNIFSPSNNLFNGLQFVKSENNTTNWESGNTPLSPIHITDNNPATIYKANNIVELDIDFDCDYAIVDTLTIQYGQNTGGGNSHYIRGDGVTISVYSEGEWREVYTEAFTSHYNCPTLTIDLGGVRAEKLRYKANGHTVYTKADGTSAVEYAVAITEMSATGSKVSTPKNMTEKDDLLLGNLFVPSAATANTTWHPHVNLTDGNEGTRYATLGNTPVDATLNFCGVAKLDTLSIKYETANRCGKNLVIEAIFNGVATKVLDHTYTEGVTNATFDLGGAYAESIRIYVDGVFEGGDCTSILDLRCSGSIGTTHVEESYYNILSGKPVTVGPATTAINNQNYGYQNLVDGIKKWTKVNGVEKGRYSSLTLGGQTTLAVMDAIFEVDEHLDLGELRIYDFNPNDNIFLGTSVQIMVMTKGSWRTLYDLNGVDQIYAPHRVDTYLSFDLGGVNTSMVRIIVKQTTSGRSVTAYEVELDASYVGYKEDIEAEKEIAAKEYEGNNVLLNIPAENLTASHPLNVNYPLVNAFDGIIDPSAFAQNRYAMGSVHVVKDSTGTQISSDYFIVVNLPAPTQLYTLSIYDWRGNDTQTRSNKTKIDLQVDGSWITMYRDVPLNFGTAEGMDHTEFYFGGLTATAIRIAFVNDNYSKPNEPFAVATIKEITCTGIFDYGTLLDSYTALDTIDTSAEFGLDEMKEITMDEVKDEMIGSDVDGLHALLTELKASHTALSQGAPVTDAHGDFTKYNVSLEGDVGFHFYGNLSADVLAKYPNANVVVSYVTVKDGVTSVNKEARPIGELAKDSEGRYVVDFNMAAAQMTDEVEIRLILDGKTCGAYIKQSIKQYAELVLANEEYAEIHEILKAMLNYGAYAQQYFGYNTDNLAAELHPLEQVTENATVSVAGAATGLKLNRWNLTLDSNVTAKLYVTLDEGRTASDYTVKVTTPAGETYTAELEAIGGRYRVSVENIVSGYLNDEYTVTFTNNADGTALTVKSSAMCYVSAILAAENADPALVDLVTALKLYSEAADAYFN